MGAALHYASNRTEGYKPLIIIPASGDTVPDVLKRIVVRVEAAGRVLERELSPAPNQTEVFPWEALDHLQGKVETPAEAKVSVGFVYDGVYLNAGDVDPAFAQAGQGDAETPARQEVTRWRRTAIPMRVEPGQLAEGWTLTSHHSINPMNPNILYKGDGSTVRKTESIIEAFAGAGVPGDSADSGPALDALMNNPAAVTAAA
ncbi:MAG: hypothetical protein GY859_35435, partial [Desulfobacterales bacterium]|nr:hypothetical protein [Desulfobacterales bacterium]